MTPAIHLEDIQKIFEFPIKDPARGFLSNFFRPDKKKVVAVNEVSCSIQKGESVAFIGPNGAGKSTCIKMLTGILYPTSGRVRVLGLDPERERQKLAYKIGTVFGQRSQLIFNLPLADSFDLFGRMYGLSSSRIKKRTDELIDLFTLGDFADQPVRKLSLGQRMRAEIAAALVHDPEIIFLDEPTIGLDIVAKHKLREVLAMLNKNFGTTIFLTSHDAGDIEALCERTIIINHGSIILDEKTENLQRNILMHKDVRLELKSPVKKFSVAHVDDCTGSSTSFRFSIDTTKYSLNAILKDVLARYDVVDMEIENPSLEEIIGSIYERPGQKKI